jgi:PAS domain S-box-containing protein
VKRASQYIAPLAGAMLIASLLSCAFALAGSPYLRQGELPVLCLLVAMSLLLLVLAGRQNRGAEQALLEDRRRLAEIVNLLPDATWAVDVNGRVLAWNRAIEELTGVKAEEIVGRDNFAYSVPFYGERRPILVDVAMAPDPEQETKYDSFSRKGETVEAEIFIPHFGSAGLFIWARARRLLDASGAVIGAIETVRDITERRRLQEIMMQTEKMLTVGGLAAGMAHEINNPLSVVLQNVQNLQRRLTPGLPANDRVAAESGLDFAVLQRYLKQRGILELLEMVESAGMRIAGIVDKMMVFSLQPCAMLEPVRLEELIDQALDLASCDYDLKKRCDFGNCQVLRDYDAELPEVVVNRAELEQALINLIKNAVHATFPCREGQTPLITVRTLQSGGYAGIQVQDNGCGMSPEVSRRMFEPFFTTKEVGVGTGLGLAVTYAVVVKNHHGSIEVDSSPGAGTTITLKLPMVPGKNSAPQPPRQQTDRTTA